MDRRSFLTRMGAGVVASAAASRVTPLGATAAPAVGVTDPQPPPFRDGYEESGPPNGNGGGFWDRKISHAEMPAKTRESFLHVGYRIPVPGRITEVHVGDFHTWLPAERQFDVSPGDEIALTRRAQQDYALLINDDTKLTWRMVEAYGAMPPSYAVMQSRVVVGGIPATEYIQLPIWGVPWEERPHPSEAVAKAFRKWSNRQYVDG